MSSNSIKSVCVVGGGAIGSLFAGHLATVVDVKLLARRQEHADRLNDQGLKISGQSDCQVSVLASTDPAELGAVDLVIIATKANAVKDIGKKIKGHFSGAAVMTVQNGLGCEDLIAECGDWPIISAVTFMSGVKHSDVHVEYELDTATWMGPWGDGQATFEEVQAVASLIETSGLKALAFEDLRPAQWSKLIFNSVVNSIGAVTDLPHIQAFARREFETDLGKLVFAMMEEGKRIAEASNVRLYEDPWQMNVKAVSHGKTGNDAYAHVFSMLSDVRACRATEADWITGAIVKEAAKLGEPVPLHEALYGLVKGLEASWEEK